MPCFSPLHGWRSRLKTALGKRAVVFKLASGYQDMPIAVPCGQCIGCRLERSRQWAMRCLHESELHEENCYLTLTFDDEHLPEGGSVNVRDLQLFFKKLRKRYASARIRYFACGEYGEGLRRPHYHALLFGFDFPDRVFGRMSGQFRLYTSEILSELWGNGMCWVGDVTFESAAYVARYVLKKQTGKGASVHYERPVDTESGEITSLVPEFIVMSRGGRGPGGLGGIGSRWFKKFRKEVYSSDEDFVVMRGIKMRPPKFYDALLEAVDPGLFQDVKIRRVRSADDPKIRANNTDGRLSVREEVQRSKMSLLKRRFEDDR